MLEHLFCHSEPCPESLEGAYEESSLGIHKGQEAMKEKHTFHTWEQPATDHGPFLLQIPFACGR